MTKTYISSLSVVGDTVLGLPASVQSQKVEDFCCTNVFLWLLSLAVVTLSGQRAVHDRWGASGSGGPQGAGQAGADAPEEGGTGDQQNH